jgi:hypothetical protein
MTLLFTVPINAQETDVLCKAVTQHTPQSDVAYQAGVDAYGNAVVPADLNSAPFQVPNVIKVPLNIDLAERMGALVDGVQLEAPLGMIEIHQDGRVRYNDQDWTAPVMTLCGQADKVKKEIPVKKIKKPREQDRLPKKDVIKSDTAVEVKPLEAVPPQDVIIEQTEIKEAEDESDIIEGGEHREIFYNE